MPPPVPPSGRVPDHPAVTGWPVKPGDDRGRVRREDGWNEASGKRCSSDDAFEIAQYRNCFRQSLALQRIEIVSSRLRRFLQPGAVLAKSRNDLALVQVDQVDDECIGVPRLYPEGRQPRRRKVLQVSCDNDIRVAADGRRQDMPVAGIGQVQAVDQCLVARDEAVGRMGIHQPPGFLKLRARQVRPVGKNAADPLFMDLRRPLRAKEAPHREPHQEVAERGRVENVGVEKGGDAARQGEQAERLDPSSDPRWIGGLGNEERHTHCNGNDARDEDGDTNYGDLLPASQEPDTAAAAEGLPVSLAVRSVGVSGSRVEYRNRQAGQLLLLDGVEVVVDGSQDQ